MTRTALARKPRRAHRVLLPSFPTPAAVRLFATCLVLAAILLTCVLQPRAAASRIVSAQPERTTRATSPHDDTGTGPILLQAQPPYLDERWRTAIWGEGIGIGRISIVDLHGDSVPEIIVGAVTKEWPVNSFWYILSYSTASTSYERVWISQDYPGAAINRIVVADGTGDGNDEIYVALSSGSVEVYDARTRALLHTLPTSLENRALQVADVDADGHAEIVVGAYAGLAVYSAVSYTLEWKTSAYHATDLVVANAAADAALEIIIPDYVLDGITHVPEWHYPSAFGFFLNAADIDGDGIAEIITPGQFNSVRAFDADTQSLKWEFNTALEVAALRVGDVDGDGTLEVLYGDGQWGSIHCHDTVTLIQEWSIQNPQSGMSDINFGDVDGDGTVEILWGGGPGSSRGSLLFVADSTTREIEWHNPLFDGPLTALDVGDVDADGAPEIVMVSFQSDGGYESGVILVYDARTYTLEWQSDPIEWISTWTGVHAVVIANVDADPALEIVIGTDDVYDGVIVVYDGVTHTRERVLDGIYGAAFYAVAAADLDADGQMEIVGGEGSWSTAVESVHARVYDAATGLEEWHTQSFGESGNIYQVAIADVDGDGSLELVASMQDGDVHVYDGVTHAWEWHAGTAGARAVHIGDVDRDGVQELLVGTADGQLRVFDGQTYVWESSIPLSTLPINAIRLADLDHDAVPELVVCDDEYLSVYDTITHSLLWQSARLGSGVAYGGHLVVRDVDDDGRVEIVVGSHYALHVFGHSLLPPIYLPFVVRHQN